MAELYFLAGFDFDGCIDIAKDGTDFVACMGVPVGKGTHAVVIVNYATEIQGGKLFSCFLNSKYFVSL